MSNAENPVLLKSVTIHESGMKTVEEGKVKLFTGFTPDVANRYTVAVLFSASNQDVSVSDFTKLMTDFEKQHSLELYVAGRDFPIHTTVGEGVVPSGIALADAFGDVSNEESRSIVFSELVMQNGNILLTTSEATPWFDDFRNRVNASYETIGFTPLPIEYLVHITLARIKQGSAEDIRALVETVCAIREDIKKEPIVAKVNRVFRGPSLSLLNKFPVQ